MTMVDAYEEAVAKLVCKAKGTSNEEKQHVWVSAVHDGKPKESCLFCGRWKL